VVALVDHSTSEAVCRKAVYLVIGLVFVCFQRENGSCAAISEMAFATLADKTSGSENESTQVRCRRVLVYLSRARSIAAPGWISTRFSRQDPAPTIRHLG
jgi:hypothetical protein